jgi:predicted O-methyltransferase YrrM
MKFIFKKFIKAFRKILFLIKKILLHSLYIKRLHALENIKNGKKIVNAITHLQINDQADCKEVIAAIEKERKWMLSCNEPLIDKTLGEGGLYDKGITISKACKVSRDQRSATLLYFLMREFMPNFAIELGTNVGISSAYQTTALKQNGKGILITLESSPYRIRLAKQLHTKLGLDNITYVEGLFSDTLEETLKKLIPINYAFIDGHHQYQPTLNYFNTLFKYAAEEAIFVFDDINWSSEMKRAWDRIKTDNRIKIAADFGSIGLCIITRNPLQTKGYITKPILLI